MALTISRFGCLALRYTSRIPSRRKPSSQFIFSRPLHVTPFHRDNDIKQLEPFKFDVSTLDADDRNRYDLLSPEEKLDYEEYAKRYHDHMNSPQVESDLNAEVSQALYESAQEEPRVEIKIPKIKVGLMAMGEKDEQDEGEDEEFQGDDITSHGHGELEQHREMREYARIAAWEMPMLSSAFVSVVATTPNRKLIYWSRACQTLCSACARSSLTLSIHYLHGRNPPRRKKDCS